ncbi:polysaccharide biosynthesis C-terminal domain-containing protein [Lachnospiraceae bacterium LCP25S3_G4]
MKILVTGSKGFIGKNLVSYLKTCGYEGILEYDAKGDDKVLEKYCKNCNFIFHLAGVNRPEKESEFMEGNYDFTNKLLQYLKKWNNKCPIVLSSSIQAVESNAYGKSKKACEELLFAYETEEHANVIVFRLPNIFGKWCKPNYNSVIATFCYNISRDLPISILKKEQCLHIAYIDDVVENLVDVLEGRAIRSTDQFYHLSIEYQITVGEIAETFYKFRQFRNDLEIPNIADSLERKLYSTYQSYLPESEFIYPLKTNVDKRGSFTEIIKSNYSGQYSINIAKPNITKGNHWHKTKCEKFIVVSGTGLIQLQQVGEEQICNFYVSGEKLEVIEIPPGYIHNIVNIGNSDLITLIWCSECFDENHPDTYFQEVGAI